LWDAMHLRKQSDMQPKYNQETLNKLINL